MTKSRHGGGDRVSTKSKLAAEMKVLGEVIVRARERAGLKQADVAARLGLPPSYLSKIENGTRRVDAIELIHIAEAMNMEGASLLGEVEQALPRTS